MAAVMCPSCGRDEGSDVTDSRPWNGAIRRRRKCQACGHCWNTVEVPFEAAEHLPRLFRDLTLMADRLTAITREAQDRTMIKRDD